MASLWRFTGSIWARRRGIPQPGGDKPTAPVVAAPIVTASSVTVTWTPPLDPGDAGIHGYTISISSPGNVAVSQSLGHRARSHTFAGLTEGTVYTITLVALNAYGTGDVATVTATPSSSATFDILAFNFATRTGPQVAQTLYTPPDATGQSMTNTPNNVEYADATTHFEVHREMQNWSNITTNAPLEWQNVGSLAEGGYAEFCHFRTTFGRQSAIPAGSSHTGVLYQPRGHFYRCKIEGAKDSMQAAAATSPYTAQYERTLFEECYIYGGRAYPQGKNYDGSWMTLAQYESIIDRTSGTTVGMAVTAGQFIRGYDSGNPSLLRVWQVTQSGTLQTETKTWPKTTYWPGSRSTAQGPDPNAVDDPQPFTSGTAQVICVGHPAHADGAQWTRTGRTIFRKCKFAETSYVNILAQSLGGTTNPFPTQAILVENCWLTGRDSGEQIYISAPTTSTANPLNDSIKLDSADNTYKLTGDIWLSQPWAMHFQDCWTGPQSNGYEHTQCTFSNNTTGNLLRSNRQTEVVPTKDRWKELVGAQFGLNPAVAADDTELEDMWSGNFNYPSRGAELNAEINQSVLAARTANGASKLDARCYIIWDNVRRNFGDRGQWVRGNAANVARRDAQGFYTGV